MKYNIPKYKLKMEFTPGCWNENDWVLGERACVEQLFYSLPGGIEFAFYKFVERTKTGKKRVRWEEWYNGNFSNNYFDCSFDTAVAYMEGYMRFNGIKGKRTDYRVYDY